MSQKKRVKSVKLELIKKAREAMLAAVQIYNNPQITFKAESFITLSVIAWTYLCHAYYKEKGIDYRYIDSKKRKKTYKKTEYGAYKFWELRHCIMDNNCPFDKNTKENLKFIIGIRNEVEHQMTNKIDEYLSAKLQACALNFDYYICHLFGDKYNLSRELSIVIQFSPITPEQQKTLINNEHITSNVKNFIADFENNLPDDILLSSHYAYRLLFTPVSVNRRGQADQVIEFIKSDSPIADEMKKTYALIKETEKKKYLPNEIVKIMKENGFTKFSIHKHTELWKSQDAKNEKNRYGVCIAKTWYWYENWLNVVKSYCDKNKENLI